ncbi:MAG: metallophosphatase family protein [Patescibacteria group bacterium]|nr:metallophosphatase family protein [Patescibacteria group bacterium]
MKLAIFSDSHDNIPNIKKALKFIKDQGIEIIIHCGDLSAPSVMTEVIKPNFNGKLYMVNGNVGDPDLLKEVAKKYKDVKVYDVEGSVEIDGIKIGFTHFPDIAKKLAQSGKYDYVFYGHSHKPWMEKISKSKIQMSNQIQSSNFNIQNELPNQPINQSTILVNPGTLAGMFYKATFAILDTKTNKLELKILDKI